MRIYSTNSQSVSFKSITISLENKGGTVFRHLSKSFPEDTLFYNSADNNYATIHGTSQETEDILANALTAAEIRIVDKDLFGAVPRGVSEVQRRIAAGLNILKEHLKVSNSN